MKNKQYHIAIAGVPRYYAVFKVKQVPDWLRVDQLTVGDLMYWSQFRSQMVKVQNSICLQVRAEHLDFVAYMTTAEMQEATYVTNA